MRVGRVRLLPWVTWSLVLGVVLQAAAVLLVCVTESHGWDHMRLQKVDDLGPWGVSRTPMSVRLVRYNGGYSSIGSLSREQYRFLASAEGHAPPRSGSERLVVSVVGFPFSAAGAAMVAPSIGDSPLRPGMAPRTPRFIWGALLDQRAGELGDAELYSVRLLPGRILLIGAASNVALTSGILLGFMLLGHGARSCFRRMSGRCPQCGYAQRGTVGVECPECGVARRDVPVARLELVQTSVWTNGELRSNDTSSRNDRA